MKPTIYFLFGLFLLPMQSWAQAQSPVQWKWSAKQIEDCEYEITFEATIEEGWHLYSAYLPKGDGPIGTTFAFENKDSYTTFGPLTETKPHQEYDPNFLIDVSFHEKQATFNQKARLNGESATISGELTFMVCNDKMCLPPEYVPFSIDIKGDCGAKPKPTESTSLWGPTSNTTRSSAPKNPVSWTISNIQTAPCKYDVLFKADIEDGWHIYSQSMPGDNGPLPVEFTINTDGKVKRQGKVQEPTPMKQYSPVWEMDILSFEKEVTFKQPIELTGSSGSVKGDVYFMVCSKKNCLAPSYQDFSLVFETDEVCPATSR